MKNADGITSKFNHILEKAGIAEYFELEGPPVDALLDCFEKRVRIPFGLPVYAEKYPHLARAITGIEITWNDENIWTDLLRYFQDLHSDSGWRLTTFPTYTYPDANFEDEKNKALTATLTRLRQKGIKPKSRKEWVCRHIRMAQQLLWLNLGEITRCIEADVATELETKLADSPECVVMVTLGWPEHPADKNACGDFSAAGAEALIHRHPLLKTVQQHIEKTGNGILGIMSRRMENHFTMSLSTSVDDDLVMEMHLEPLHSEDQHLRTMWNIQAYGAELFEVAVTMHYLTTYMFEDTEAIWFY